MIYGMATSDAQWGPWRPSSVAEVASIFSAFEGRWWVAGGRAIELAVGHRIRNQEDIDVLILRRDHPKGPASAARLAVVGC
jgi:hypothetical protein